jgi:2-polyprenyl-3-methyl-5-hydroxy-6-metoxy-1,4-benzoquinol methylase
VEADAHWKLVPARCPVCEDERGRFVGFRGGWAHRAGAGVAVAIVRCQTCGLLYPQPRPEPRDLSHYRDADAYFRREDHTVAVAAHVETLRQAARVLGATGRLLDIGCGLGESLVAARESGWEARGIEPSAEFARQAVEAHGVDVRCVTIEDADEPSDHYDLVLLSGVLEHVDDPMLLLRQSQRVLTPGGLVFIDVPNERSLVQHASRLVLRARGRNWTTALSPTFAPFHVVGFSPRSLRFALRRVGLQPRSLRTYPLSYEGVGSGSLARVLALVERVAGAAHGASGLVAWAAKRA